MHSSINEKDVALEDCQLYFITHFTSELRYFSGKGNVDVHSLTESVIFKFPSFIHSEIWEKFQTQEYELKTLLAER